MAHFRACVRGRVFSACWAVGLRRSRRERQLACIWELFKRDCQPAAACSKGRRGASERAPRVLHTLHPGAAGLPGSALGAVAAPPGFRTRWERSVQKPRVHLGAFRGPNSPFKTPVCVAHFRIHLKSIHGACIQKWPRVLQEVCFVGW